jgi:hypothetical protein
MNHFVYYPYSPCILPLSPSIHLPAFRTTPILHHISIALATQTQTNAERTFPPQGLARGQPCRAPLCQPKHQERGLAGSVSVDEMQSRSDAERSMSCVTCLTTLPIQEYTACLLQSGPSQDLYGVTDPKVTMHRHTSCRGFYLFWAIGEKPPFPYTPATTNPVFQVGIYRPRSVSGGIYDSALKVGMQGTRYTR